MPTSGVITGCTEGFDDFLRSGLDEPDLAAEGIGAVFCKGKPAQSEKAKITDS